MGLAPVIVKGQAIVDLAYPADQARLAGDVDLLVGQDEAAVCNALLWAGYKEKTHAKRAHSAPLLGERAFIVKSPALPSLVEVHRFLDKAILRPVDYAGILARATPSQRAGFRYPTAEDLLLLVVLHESVAQTPSMERTQRDLDMLMRNTQPNMNIVRARAQAWELSRALETILQGQAPHTTKDASPFRYFWQQRQQHDSQLTWAMGLGRYVYKRLADRLG